MRLFTALDLAPGVAANLERLLKQLRPTARIQWSPPANLHITTKFIGEWPDERLAELRAALAAGSCYSADSHSGDAGVATTLPAAGRRSRISSMPATGCRARISTQPGVPAGSVTRLRHSYMP